MNKLTIIRFLLLFSLILFGLQVSSARKSVDEQQLPCLSYSNASLGSLLNDYIVNKADVSDSQQVLVLRIGEFNGNHEIRLAAIDTSNFSLLLCKKKDRPLGWIRLHGILVIVFGIDHASFFEIGTCSAIFDFIETSPTEDLSKEESYCYNGVIFEPIVYIYDYNSSQDEFVFVKSSRVSLLK